MGCAFVKRCTRCAKAKPLDEFVRDRRRERVAGELERHSPADVDALAELDAA